MEVLYKYTINFAHWDAFIHRFCPGRTCSYIDERCAGLIEAVVFHAESENLYSI